jgi:UDP-N-acetylmuramoyl-L-alanyl-D-glutamate--2,6-diaminopimelate ligase
MLKFETDSRLIQKGQTFVAIKGHTVDGHEYIENAIKNGATDVIAEHDVKCKVPVTIVKDSELYLKEELKKIYSDKLNKLKIIGVTGTNGKTTTCYLTYQLLQKLGVKVAYLGTIGFYYEDKIIHTENTTPDTLTIYKLLMEAMDDGITTIVMEVSSHSLAFNRLYGLHLDEAAFTNLTEDHLDYHKTMENYLNCKLKIFDLLDKDGTMVVNSDDEYSKYFIEKANKWKTLGLNGNYKIVDFKTTAGDTDMNLEIDGNKYNVKTNLTSKFNVYNFLTAVALIHELGYKTEDILKYSEDVKPPKGRCETFKVNGGYAIVDYAHTPDAVLKVVTAYNELKTNKVITLVGCGGDRDPLKRPIMGDIATKLSDYVIFTEDNPRTEDPHKIMDDILKGVKKNNYEVIYDRPMAIKKGIDMMEKGDILLLLGKGHEDYQIIGHTKHHLDDSEEVLKWHKEA